MLSQSFPRSTAEPAQTCNLPYIARRLGKAGWGDRRCCTYLQALIDTRGFPAPFPELVATGPKLPGIARARHLTDRVRPASSWQRDAVDCWFGDFLPPEAAAALDAAAQAEAAAQMDARACALQLVRA